MKKIITKIKNSGFTLLEMLLVLVLASSMLIIMLNLARSHATSAKADKTSLEMQQVLEAGVSYSIDNDNVWPTLDQLTDSSTYLPSDFGNNLWGNPITVDGGKDGSAKVFIVSTIVPSQDVANDMRAQLPLSKVTPIGSDDDNKGYTVTTQVNIPSYNYNNAGNVGFTNNYHNGQCVPKPACPVGMKPMIFTTPEAVTGVTDGKDDSNIYNLQALSAYATDTPSGATDPAKCDGSAGFGDPCDNVGGSTDNWRVCLTTKTEAGNSASDNPDLGVITAFTRCVPDGSSAQSPAQENNKQQATPLYAN